MIQLFLLAAASLVHRAVAQTYQIGTYGNNGTPAANASAFNIVNGQILTSGLAIVDSV